MTRVRKFLLLSCLINFSLFADAQLISDSKRLENIQQMLEVQQRLTARGETDIWNYLKKDMTMDEKQALRFLYAYMPLSDMADYSPGFITGMSDAP